MKIRQLLMKRKRKITIGLVTSLILTVMLFVGSGLYLSLTYQCSNWYRTGLETDISQQPVRVMRSLAKLVSEPVCESWLDDSTWSRLADAYTAVPSVENLNQRRALGALQEANIASPGNHTLMIKLAEALISLGQFNYALRPALLAQAETPEIPHLSRLLSAAHTVRENYPAAADILRKQFQETPASTLPLWAILTAETVLSLGINDKNADILDLLEPEPTEPVSFNLAVGMAFRHGLQGNENNMRQALEQLDISQAPPADMLDAVKLYEQLGLNNQVIAGLLARPITGQDDQAKLRAARALWLQSRHQEIITLFGEDTGLVRREPEAGLILALSAHTTEHKWNFSKQLLTTGDEYSGWDRALMDFTTALSNSQDIYAVDMLDHVLAMQEYLPRSGVLSITAAAVWQHIDEPELVRSNLDHARAIMGAPLTRLERIPEPKLSLRQDPAREELGHCASEQLSSAEHQTSAVIACWTNLMNKHPRSMLVVRAALSDPRLAKQQNERSRYLDILQQNSPKQAAFWRRATARDLLAGNPTEPKASQALILLRPLLQQPQPRAETLLLAASAYGALHDPSRAFQHLSEVILLQPTYAPAVHGLSLDIYQDQAALLPRTLIQWWEVFAVLEGQAAYGDRYEAKVRQQINDVLDRRYRAMNRWAQKQEDERLLVALSSLIKGEQSPQREINDE